MGDKPVKRIWITPTIALGMLVAGCAGVGSKSGGSSPTTPPENMGVVVTVAPATAMVRAGATQAFTAAVTGNANTSVTWSVNAAA
jgi:predicted P-loop ATPase/GTPase